MTLIEITPADAAHVAAGIAYAIQELHALNVERLEKQIAMRRSRDEVSAAAVALLGLSFGFMQLAVRVAHLQSASENEEYAQKYWTKIATFN